MSNRKVLTNNRKKIGIFSGYAIPHLGGVERYVDKLSSELLKLGYDIVIVTSNHSDLPAVEVNNSIKTYRLPIRNFAKTRYPIPRKNKLYKDLIAQIKTENIDYYLLNTRFHLTSLIGARLGSYAQRPVLLIEHGTDHFTVNNKILDFFGKIYEHILTNIIKRHVDKYYGVSKKCNEWLSHFNINASGVFYNAIDVADKYNSKDLYAHTYPEKSIVITYAGRLIKEKGVLNLLDAFELVRNNTKLKLFLVIAGDGSLLEYIKQQYARPEIKIVGRLDFEHVMSLYKRTNIFVYPSLYPEGLPTSILEAALMDSAIIATPRGGTEEVILDDQHGIIVDGSVESLQSALEQLVNDEGKTKKLASTARSRVEKVFSWKAVAKVVDSEIKSFNSGQA